MDLVMEWVMVLILIDETRCENLKDLFRLSIICLWLVWHDSVQH